MVDKTTDAYYCASTLDRIYDMQKRMQSDAVLEDKYGITCTTDSNGVCRMSAQRELGKTGLLAEMTTAPAFPPTGPVDGMEALFTLGSMADSYLCPSCSANIPCDWGIACTPVIDCTACDFVGVLMAEPESTIPNKVQYFRVALRAVKHVRVDETSDIQPNEEADIDPPAINATDGARAAGIDVVSGNVMWLTTTDDVVHGYHKST